MKRFYIPLGIFAVLVVLFAVALVRSPEKGVIPSALIGKPAPAFTLPDLLRPGESVRLADYKGRWLLINMWATWCAPCRQEHPVLVQIAREAKVGILGVTYKDDDDKSRQWLAELGNPYIAVGTDTEAVTAIDYGVYAAPESFLVNPDGVIVEKVLGIVTPKKWREELLPIIEGNRT